MLIPSEMPNAFVSEILPHRIFITTSLFEKFIESQDELALVLGHEISVRRDLLMSYFVFPCILLTTFNNYHYHHLSALDIGALLPTELASNFRQNA